MVKAESHAEQDGERHKIHAQLWLVALIKERAIG
jgi:hypothetical protein